MRTYELKKLPEFVFEDMPDGDMGVHEHFYLGGNAIVLKNKFLKDYFPAIIEDYGFRNKIVLKVRGIRPGAIHLSISELEKLTKIQNIFAFYEMAPRVFDIIKIR